MTNLYYLARLVFRFIVVWVVDALAIGITALIFPGIALQSPSAPPYVLAAAVAFLLGIVNLLVRPLVLLLARPLGFVALFIVGLLLNAVALMITSFLLPGFVVDGWLNAFFGSLLIALINTVITSAITVDDEDSFYEGIVERLAAREGLFADDFNTRGLVMIEIDGLSYHHIKKAIAGGWMPTLKRMMDEEGYVLSRFDCGLPSQTSACQAGIMFGDNYDIPAFRWYDKRAGRLIASGHDAPMINARFARGHGLMRAGSSVNNMLNGDARISILTLADLFGGTPEQQRRRAQDIYLLMLNPYFLMRELVLYLGDVVLEVFQGLRQQLRKEAPRLNRLEHFYPFIRAATTVLMRDISAYLAILDIIRGTPALYVTWPGYDEVAHHSGPWTKDAFHTLKQYDRVIARVRDIIRRKAPRPYELVILSDHGQSYGWTFKQRYGKSLKEYIEECLPHGTMVEHTAGGDDGTLSVGAMAMELDNLHAQEVGGRVGRRVVRGARRIVRRGIRERGPQAPLGSEHIAPPEAVAEERPPVTVCASGNLAQVYFNLRPERVTLDELNEAYPGLVDKLVQHEGIGLVVAYNEQGEPLAFGKKGARNLHTGAVTGEDPLASYCDGNGDSNAELRAAQVRRIADYPSNGDLTIISTYYPDGTVAAMEELVGNHGGLGGEQTDAFLFHPPDLQVPATKNSAEVYHILNARRGLPAPERSAPAPTPKVEQLDPWRPQNLRRGLSQFNRWVGLALRALALDRSAYAEVTRDYLMTAPALLIALAASLLTATAFDRGVNLAAWGTRFASWLVLVLVLYGAGRILGGKGSFTATLRAAGFAQMAYALELFELLEPLAELAHLAARLLAFIATWIAVSQAQRLGTWRALVLPVAAILVAVIAVVVLDVLLRGTQLTLTTLAQELGIVAR